MWASHWYAALSGAALVEPRSGEPLSLGGGLCDPPPACRPEWGSGVRIVRWGRQWGGSAGWHWGWRFVQCASDRSCWDVTRARPPMPTLLGRTLSGLGRANLGWTEGRANQEGWEGWG